MTQAQKQEQVEISKSPNLKEKLDEIDQTVYQEVHEDYKKSRMKVLVGMWEKGKVIGDSRGGEPPTGESWNTKRAGIMNLLNFGMIFTGNILIGKDILLNMLNQKRRNGQEKP